MKFWFWYFLSVLMHLMWRTACRKYIILYTLPTFWSTFIKNVTDNNDFNYYLLQYKFLIFSKISNFLTFHYPADKATGWNYMSPAPTLGCCSLLPPPLPPLTDSYLSLSIINTPLPSFTSFQPNPLRLCSGTQCLVLRYQMARQMTSPWPHYTRAHRHNGAVTKHARCRNERSECTRDLYMQTPRMDRGTCGRAATNRLALMHITIDNGSFQRMQTF